MEGNYSKDKLSQTKLWKKLLSIFLAVIMGFSTFIAMTFSNLFLSDYVDFMSLIKAEAAISPVPLYYRYGELVGLYTLDYTNSAEIQYKIGEDGEWTDYSVPFSIPAFTTTKVYARIGEDGKITYLNVSTSNEAIGVYTEGNTDFEFSYNNIDFGYTRIYNSADKDWFESIHSRVLVTNSRLEVQLPDSSKYPMIKKDADTYVDELNGYVLTKTDDNYIFDDGAYKYYFEIKALQSVAYLSAIEDYYGNRLNLSRTTNSEEISISDGAGRSFALSDYRAIEAPDGSDAKYYSVKEITDPNNNKLEYTTKLGRYIKVTDQAGVILGQYEYSSETTDYTLIRSMDKSISYYDNGRVKSVTYDNGSYIKYTYDDEHMTYTTLTSSGEATKTVYNDAFLPVEYTDEYGQTTSYTYDSRYRVVTETTDGSTTTYTYDSMGNIISAVTDDDEADNTYYTYDDNGNIIREQTGDSYNYYTYNDNKNVLVSATLKEDYEGEIPTIYSPDLTCFDKTEYTYDSNGRVVEENSSFGSVYKYEYDESGNVLKETSTSIDEDETTTTVTSYTYDSLGNVLNTTCDKDTASYTYDNAGRNLLAKEGDSVTRTLYDDYGRVVQEISTEDYDSTKDGLPDENTYADSTAGQTYVYAENGNLESETNRLGVTTTYQYNDVGAKIKESFDIYEFNYTDNGDLLNVKIGGNETISYTYDNSGNLVSENYANGDTIRYAYNDDGYITAQYRDDSTSPYVTFVYNTEGELTQKINYDSDLKYVYGENSSVEVYRMSDNALIQSYSEVVTEADEEQGIEAQTDITGSLFGTSYHIVSKENSLFHAVNSTNRGPNYTSTVDENGKITSDIIKNGTRTIITSEYNYDDSDNIIEKAMVTATSDTSVVNDYDDKGRIIGTGYGGASQRFTYDDNSQLISAKNGFGVYQSDYTYDSRGNVTLRETYDRNGESQGATTFTYSDSGWKDLLTQVNDDTLTYDANGNVLTYGDKEFTWNTGRHLESITDGENEYTYTYDEEGIRTSKTVNGVTTYYATQDGVILSQTDGTNTMHFQYDSYGVPMGLTYNGKQYLYMTNQMGDVISIVNTGRKEVVQYEYDEWGNTVVVTLLNNTDEERKLAEANPLRYRGYYLDTETNYYYLQSRYYDPSICRFINADDISYLNINDYNGLNLFAYCSNDAINDSDHTGNMSEKQFLGMIGLGMTVYNGHMCVRLYTWGFLHKTKNKYYDFSKSWNSLIVDLMKKSTLISTVVHEMIYDARRKRKSSYTNSTYFDFYYYHKNVSDIDLILSLGKGSYMTITVKNANKVKSGKYQYKVTCSLENENFDFAYWTKDNAHSNNTFIKLINNIGFYTQKVGVFVKFKFKFSVSYDYWYKG